MIPLKMVLIAFGLAVGLVTLIYTALRHTSVNKAIRSAKQPFNIYYGLSITLFSVPMALIFVLFMYIALN